MSALSRVKAADPAVRQEVAAFLAEIARRLSRSTDSTEQIVTDLENQANSLAPGGPDNQGTEGQDEAHGSWVQPVGGEPAEVTNSTVQQGQPDAEQEAGKPAMFAHQGEPGTQAVKSGGQSSSVQKVPKGSAPPAQKPANG